MVIQSGNRRSGRSTVVVVRAFRTCALGYALAVATAGAWSQSLPTTPPVLVEELRQQQRQKALQEQQERSVDARLPAPVATETRLLPANESPCFRIDRIALTGERSDDFQWSVSDLNGPGGNDSPLHRCLGTEGVNIVLARAQQVVLARGYVTTRILAGAQDLSKGTLTLTVIPGRIAAIRFSADTTAGTTAGAARTLRTAIPAQPGDLLNLRDIEQGLENFKRVPTAEADIQIEPSTAADAQPGDSDLVVKYVQTRKFRGSFSLDDSGGDSTGRLQAGATVSADNLLGLNDLFYVNASHSVDGLVFDGASHGTEGQTVHYSLPWGYWLLGATASNNRYRQSVAGLTQDYVYAGTTNNAELKLSRLVYRDQHRKTTVAVRAFRRESRNYVDDTEVQVQHRVVGGWEASLNHKEFIGAATLEGTLAYRRGTGAFGSIESPEQGYGEGTSRFGLITSDVTLNAPFSLGGQKFRYSGQFRAQWNQTPLTPQDRFSIGGRYTVRGFDGATSLIGDRGWLVRNDIGWAMGQSGAELYAGLDYGQVGGRSARGLLGDHLAGAVVGVRGAFRSLSYDLFIGAPVWKPAGYRTSRVTAGFSLNFSF